jgi:phenylalanyl-tRNA synthetase beta chain
LVEGVARKFDIKQQVFLAEISLSALISESTRVVEYSPLPVYPAAPRDLAIVVDKGVRVDDIIARVKQTAGALAESVSVFDLYTGKQIESGKKSIGIAISYRSPERSLSSEEVDVVQKDVINLLKEDFKAEVRDK